MKLFYLIVYFFSILLYPLSCVAIQVGASISPEPSQAIDTPAFLIENITKFSLILPAVDAEIPAANTGPIQTGIVYNLPIAITSSELSWTPINNGYVAHIHLQALQAQKLRIQLSQISPNSGISLRVKGNLDALPLGPIALDNEQIQALWLPVSKGDSCDLEVFIAHPSSPSSISFSLSAINYIVADASVKSNAVSAFSLGKATEPEYDLSCYSTNSNYAGLKLAAAATAKINFIKNGSSYICTGTLLNDLNGTNTPWFATANHCLGEQSTANTASFEWFFQATQCASSQSDSRYSQTYGGATLLWTDFYLEAAFLKLNKPPANNAIFSGWNTAINYGDRVWGIHHPRGDQTMVSQGSVIGLLERVDDLSQGGTHRLDAVNYIKGGIEPGSSGSGLFSISGSTAYWLGTLFGGSNNNYQLASYSHFQNYFAKLQTWLAPPKPVITFTAQPSIVNLGGQTMLTWSSKNATSCTASGSWIGNKNTSGSQSTGAITSNQIYTLKCSGGGGDTNATVKVAVKPTLSLQATPTIVNYNSPTNLQWLSTNTNSCKATGGWSGTVNSSGNQTSSALINNKSFTLSCTGDGGSVSATVTVAVIPTLTFSTPNNTIDYLGKALLQWKSNNATQCKANGNWSGSKALEGSQSITNLTSKQNYQLTCTGAGGSVTNSEAIAVKPQISLSVLQSKINYGEQSKLSWTSKNADSCSASGAWSGVKATQGTESTGSLTSDQSFSLSCSNSAGSSSATVLVTIKPQIVFTATATSIAYNTSSVLQWSADNALNCSASGAWSGAVPITGNQTTKSLTSNKTFTLTCTNQAGTSTKSLTVLVLPNISLSATPSTVNNNASTTLKWSASNATSCTASGAWSGNKATTGSLRINKLTSTQNYSLSCKGSGGTSTSNVTVTVI